MTESAPSSNGQDNTIWFSPQLTLKTMLLKYPNEFQIIISDREMTSIKSIDFLIAVREMFADIPFLMVSGYTATQHTTQTKHFYICGYIVKPSSKQKLIAKVKQLI